MTDRHAAPRSAPAQRQVEDMFDAVAATGGYDRVNAVLSMGQDAWWRARAERWVRSSGALRPNGRVLDLGCGTGKLTERFSGSVGMDLSREMLRGARGRMPSMPLVQGSAFALPFASATFDAVVSGFVLRNLVDLAGAFTEVQRVVRPGGVVALVDITGPRSGLLRKGFDAYFGVAAPVLGKVIGGDAGPYRYLAKSLAQLPRPADVARMLDDAGLDGGHAQPMSMGMVTMWTARKSREAAA